MRDVASERSCVVMPVNVVQMLRRHCKRMPVWTQLNARDLPNSVRRWQYRLVGIVRDSASKNSSRHRCDWFYRRSACPDDSLMETATVRGLARRRRRDENWRVWAWTWLRGILQMRLGAGGDGRDASGSFIVQDGSARAACAAEAWAVNVGGTQHVVDAARRVGNRAARACEHLRGIRLFAAVGY